MTVKLCFVSFLFSFLPYLFLVSWPGAFCPSFFVSIYSFTSVAPRSQNFRFSSYNFFSLSLDTTSFRVFLSFRLHNLEDCFFFLRLNRLRYTAPDTISLKTCFCIPINALTLSNNVDAGRPFASPPHGSFYISTLLP